RDHYHDNQVITITGGKIDVSDVTFKHNRTLGYANGLLYTYGSSDASIVTLTRAEFSGNDNSFKDKQMIDLGGKGTALVRDCNFHDNGPFDSALWVQGLSHAVVSNVSFTHYDVSKALLFYGVSQGEVVRSRFVENKIDTHGHGGGGSTLQFGTSTDTGVPTFLNLLVEDT